MMEILCCNCGINIRPNIRNMCERCIVNQVDLLGKLRTGTTIESCRGCERYFIPPKSWKPLAWGSQDLLIFCLGRNKTIKKLNIVDSNFVYTEEHSKKMNIEIKVVEDGITQTAVLKYTIRNKQCGDCMRAESKQFWNSIVQLRQHPANPRTFLYLEQLVRIHKAHQNTTNLKTRKDGIDFYFTNRSDALKLTKFIDMFFGIRTKESNRVISEDRSNNTTNNKTTFSCVLLPFCKDDLVFFSGNLYLVDKVNRNIELIDIKTLQKKVISHKQYFGNEMQYKILQSSNDLTEYDVILSYKSGGLLNLTIQDEKERVFELTVSEDLMGRIVEGDRVMGYHTEGKGFIDDFSLPEVILVRKFNNFKKEYKLKVDKELNRDMRLFLADIDKEMLKELCEEEADDLTKKLMAI